MKYLKYDFIKTINMNLDIKDFNIVDYEYNKLINAQQKNFFDEEYTYFLAVCTKGLYFGYPKCCILHYYHNYSFQNHKLNCDNICKKASGRTGFIPCYNHSKDIIDKKIKISDLIDFPKDPDKSTCSINSIDFFEKEIDELYEIYMDN
jgi:hypothetical protein